MATKLESLIASLSLTNDADPAATHAAVVAKTRKVIVYEGLQTIAAYTKAYGVQATADLLLATEIAIEKADRAMGLFIRVYSQRFINTGLDLSDDQTQVIFDELSPLIGADLVDSIKRLGAYRISLADSAGISDPSVNEVKTAIAAVTRGGK